MMCDILGKHPQHLHPASDSSEGLGGGYNVSWPGGLCHHSEESIHKNGCQEASHAFSGVLPLSDWMEW